MKFSKILTLLALLNPVKSYHIEDGVLELDVHIHDKPSGKYTSGLG
jgi:hypothetical protein